ncbi:MAG: patatin-like phospholipase family protein [Bacteroidales bacterium]|nr:patatin-like phospholipase family protein [Bacteroidales bacterium]
MMFYRIKKKVHEIAGKVFLLLFLCVAVSVQCQLPASKQRKTVGLVLSGGGAKGVAHIGAIRALEEAGIPIDYIAGTSAGAIVGGLYASGYTVDQIEDIFLSEEFDDWINGRIDDVYSYFFKKEIPNPRWVGVNMDLDRDGVNFKIPSSLVSPVLIDFAFMEIFAGPTAVSKGNFDSLFIPFRCVAADINKRKPFYFSKGDLGLAIRASMTFPFYFNPITYDSVLYFDGGLYDNFPIQKMKEDFSPDIIIGIKVSGEFPEAKEGNVVSLVQRMVSIETNYTLDSTIRGIILEPKVPALHVIDFSNTPEVIQIGYNEVKHNLDTLRKLVTDYVSPVEIIEKRAKFIARQPLLIIDSVNVKGVNKHQTKYVKKLLSMKDNHHYTISYMRRSYLRLFSDPNIFSVHPTIVYDSASNNYTVTLYTQMKDAITANIGGNVSLGSPSQIYSYLDYRHTGVLTSQIASNLYIGRFYNSVNPFFRVDYPTKVPFYTKVEYVYNGWNYYESSVLSFDIEQPIYLKQREHYFAGSIGFPVGQYAKMSLKVSQNFEHSRYYQNFTHINFNDTSDYTSFKPFTASLAYERNLLNYPQYATSGMYFLLSTSYVSGIERFKANGVRLEYEKDHKWLQFRARYNEYFKLGVDYSLGISAEGFYTLGTKNLLFYNYLATLLHADNYAPIVELSQNFIQEYRSFEYMALGLQNVYHLAKKIHLRAECYIYQPIREICRNENDEAYFGPYFDKRYLLASAGIVYHAPIGPISLMFNYRQEGRNEKRQIFSVVGTVGFTLYNKRVTEH